MTTNQTKTATPVTKSAPVVKSAPLLSSTAKGRKVAKQETTKELTAAQSASLAKLVSAATAAITQSEANGGKAVELAIALESTVAARDDYKVYAARAMARLSAHPAVVAVGGPTKGTPALTKMAPLIGRPATSLETYWKAARALIAKGWHTRTGAPKADERALVGEPFKSESERVSVSQAKGKATPKGTGKGTPSTTVSVATISGQLDAVVASLTKFTASMGMTDAQAKDLFAKLDAATDLIESAIAK